MRVLYTAKIFSERIGVARVVAESDFDLNQVDFFIQALSRNHV